MIFRNLLGMGSYMPSQLQLPQEQVPKQTKKQKGKSYPNRGNLLLGGVLDLVGGKSPEQMLRTLIGGGLADMFGMPRRR